MNWYLIVLKKYAVFSGRARRKEYWIFNLINAIVYFILDVMAEQAGINADTLSNIYGYAISIPYIAVSVRRMHDIGKNGWFWVIPIYSLFLLVREGDKVENKYGADPKADALNIQSSQ